MISLSGAVTVIVYVVVAGLVFGLLWWLVTYCESQFPSALPFWKFARIGLVVLACLVLIGVLVSVVGGTPIFRQ